jgi:hypothetical protein
MDSRHILSQITASMVPFDGQMILKLKSNVITRQNIVDAHYIVS